MFHIGLTRPASRKVGTRRNTDIANSQNSEEGTARYSYREDMRRQTLAEPTIPKLQSLGFGGLIPRQDGEVFRKADSRPSQFLWNTADEAEAERRGSRHQGGSMHELFRR